MLEFDELLIISLSKQPLLYKKVPKYIIEQSEQILHSNYANNLKRDFIRSNNFHKFNPTYNLDSHLVLSLVKLSEIALEDISLL